MGHQTILVIGDNFLDQLGKFQCTDFLDYARKNYGVDIPVRRLPTDPIPEINFDWFECTLNYWKLKPGAEGFNVNFNEEFCVATEFAGSAKKAAIDLANFWDIIGRCTAERWDQAIAACGSQTWESYQTIWDKYKSEKYSDQLSLAAYKEWSEQAAVTAILDMVPPDESLWKVLSDAERDMKNRLWKNLSRYDIDGLLMPRDKYVKIYDLGNLLGYSEIIMDGVLLKDTDERALFDSLADDTLLTIAYVHS
jgi:hypothetical protein